jgi:HSP20 family protein
MERHWFYKEIVMASSQKPAKRLTNLLEQEQHFLNPFVHIQQEVDKALHGFYDLFEARPFDEKRLEKLSLSPAMDLVEDKECFKIEVEMPGLDEKDIKLTLNNNLLTIVGEKSVSSKDQNKNYIAREISYGRYERSITLPQNSDLSRISASFKKGMLWVTIPKKLGNSTKEQQIKIQKV